MKPTWKEIALTVLIVMLAVAAVAVWLCAPIP